MKDISPWVQLMVPVLAGLAGFFSGYVQNQAKSRDERTKEKEKESSTLRLNFLEPLRVATKDFQLRMELIQYKLHNDSHDRKERMMTRYQRLKHPNQRDRLAWLNYCNGEGYFATSTIYLAAVYFYHATRTRHELPLSALNPGDDKQLLDCLDAVRTAFGKSYGIYETLQDSVGIYMQSESKSVMSYRRFCENMYRDDECVWLLRVIDFYSDIDKKTDEERLIMIGSLAALSKFVEQVTGMSANITSDYVALYIEGVD